MNNKNVAMSLMLAIGTLAIVDYVLRRKAGPYEERDKRRDQRCAYDKKVDRYLKQYMAYGIPVATLPPSLNFGKRRFGIDKSGEAFLSVKDAQDDVDF